MLKRVNEVWGKKGKNLIARPKIKANKKLTLGPAKETLRLPHFWSLKLKGLPGTGFAQPIIGPWPAVIKSKSKGKIIVPNMSICFKGFKVSLPAFFAVGSPNCKAALP